MPAAMAQLSSIRKALESHCRQLVSSCSSHLLVEWAQTKGTLNLSGSGLGLLTIKACHGRSAFRNPISHKIVSPKSIALTFSNCVAIRVNSATITVLRTAKPYGQRAVARSLMVIWILLA